MKNKLITTYLYNAYTETITKTHPDYLDWKMNHYIQLVYYKQPIEGILIDYVAGTVFSNHKLLSTSYEGDKFYERSDKEKVINLVIDYLNQGKKLYFIVDDFYCPYRPSYQKNHNKHDMMIIDVDIEKKEFMYYGYCNGMYALKEILFDNFYLAFSFGDICVLALSVNNQVRYEFSIHRLVAALTDYINGGDSFEHIDVCVDNTEYMNEYMWKPRYQYRDVFGINVYERVQKYLSIFMEEVDIRIFHLLLQHKQHMLEILNYCDEKILHHTLSQEIEAYQEAVRLSDEVLLACIKYNRKRNDSLIIIIKNKIQKIKEVEYDTFSRFIGKVNSVT